MPKRLKESGIRSAKREVKRQASISRADGAFAAGPAGGPDGLTDLVSARLYVHSLHDLDELSAWLVTFRERLRVADGDERSHVAAVVQEIEVQYRQRRAELA